MVKLSILDQSPVAPGQSPGEALRQTIELAQMADREGFARFWVAEHHDTGNFAGSAPEILIAHIAAVTERIRVGSGGVMLPHYSAYKVAEQFRVLEALHPGRIDLGVGRAPGGMPRASYALGNGSPPNARRFPEQVEELSMYVHDRLPSDHPYAGLRAYPLTEGAPDIWMLGSSESSSAFAADLGLPYMFAHFINPEGGAHFMDRYRSRFRAAAPNAHPQAAVAVFIVCAETDAEAEYLAGSNDLALRHLEHGVRSDGVPSAEEAARHVWTPFEEERRREHRKRLVVGTPLHVKRQIEELATAYGAGEVMLVSITPDFRAKRRSFELIKRAFDRESE